MQDQQQSINQPQVMPTTNLVESQASATPTPASGSTNQQLAIASSDPLEQAKIAIDTCLAQTMTKPSQRAQSIAKIKAAYIKAKFGVDVPQ